MGPPFSKGGGGAGGKAPCGFERSRKNAAYRTALRIKMMRLSQPHHFCVFGSSMAGIGAHQVRGRCEEGLWRRTLFAALWAAKALSLAGFFASHRKNGGWKFRAVRGATRGFAPEPHKPLKRLVRNFYQIPRFRSGRRMIFPLRRVAFKSISR